jgi:peptidyl-prolyl cis-trans isomerase SurA
MTGRKKSGRWVGACLLALLCMAASAEVVDRAIAVVNGHLVTWSDLDEQMRFEALENGRPLKELTDADRRAAFDRLVQDWILRDQMQGTVPATDADVDARIASLRAALHMDAGSEGGDAKWVATLNSYGLSMDELRALAANQLEILRFLEFRVRPLVRVSRQEVEEYYTQTLAPQVRAQGQTPEPEEQVSAKIRELLEEQKMNQEMRKWLDTMRSQSRVQVLWDAVR